MTSPQPSIEYLSDKVVKIDGVEYEIPNRQAVAASKIAVEVYETLGRPTNVFSKSGTRMLQILISIWEDSYPEEAKQWHAEREAHKKAEMTIKEQVSKQTGRSLASYPLFLYKAMKLFFTDNKFSDRETVLKLVKRFPIFKMVNQI